MGIAARISFASKVSRLSEPAQGMALQTYDVGVRGDGSRGAVGLRAWPRLRRRFRAASQLFHGTNKVSRAHDPERRG